LDAQIRMGNPPSKELLDSNSNSWDVDTRVREAVIEPAPAQVLAPAPALAPEQASAEKRPVGRYASSPGLILDGKYQLGAYLGGGGMGYVVAAEHLELGRKVAIKFMREMFAYEKEAAKRFAFEAKAVARIENDHIIRVYDVGATPDGVPYMVMEYLEGLSLKDLMRAVSPIPFAVTAEWLVQLCDALSEAHRAGIVHRDLKPENLFVTRKARGVVLKVLDFGVAKDLPVEQKADSGLTRPLALIGTPNYNAPEQILDARSVDARADIWSAGAVGYCLIANEHAFPGMSASQVCQAILRKDPEPLRARRPDVPAALERAVLRCLLKDRTKRPQTADALGTELGKWLAQVGAPSEQDWAPIRRALQEAGPEGVASVPPARVAVPKPASKAPENAAVQLIDSSATQPFKRQSVPPPALTIPTPLLAAPRSPSSPSHGAARLPAGSPGLGTPVIGAASPPMGAPAFRSSAPPPPSASAPHAPAPSGSAAGMFLMWLSIVLFVVVVGGLAYLRFGH
jgi:serine/threonine-protein kinase